MARVGERMAEEGRGVVWPARVGMDPSATRKVVKVRAERGRRMFGRMSGG